MAISFADSYSGRGNRSNAIYDRSYQDWHQKPSLERFKAAAYCADADLLAVQPRELEPEGEPFAEVTLFEVEGRKNTTGHVKNLPQVLMITEAKCFDRYPADKPPPVEEYNGENARTYFSISVQMALAKAALVPLYLIGYRHYEDDIPVELGRSPKHQIPEAQSADIEWFYIALLWPQAKKTFVKLGPQAFADALMKQREKLAKFNENVKALRGDVHKMGDNWQDLFGEAFKVPHPPATPLVPAGVAYCDPGNEALRAEGYQDRESGSKGVRSHENYEAAVVLPSPAPMPVSPTNASLGPPPTVQVAEAPPPPPPVERSILHKGETRGGGPPPDGETRKK